MSSQRRHPRARALSIAYVLMGVGFLIFAALAGLITHDSATTVIGINMFAAAFALGLLLSGGMGLLPRGGTLSGADRGAILAAAVVSGIAGLVAIVSLGVSHPHRLSLAIAVATCTLSLVAAALALARVLGRR